MKIGLIVHSHTGNTLSVAQKVKSELEKKGHLVVLEQLIPVDEEGTLKGNFELKSNPDLSEYELIIFASPVWAFSLPGVMKQYLMHLPSLKDKKVFCFVTQSLSSAFFGGNSSIKTIKKTCEEKGAVVIGSSIVSWNEKKREKKTLELLDKVKMMSL